MSQVAPKRVPLADLIEDYDGILLDAYGVLVDHSGALPGAVKLIDLLIARCLPFRVVSNDSSRTPQTSSQKFANYGLAIGPEQIASSGQLLPDYFASKGLGGARALVLGTPDTHHFVEQAGGRIVDIHPSADFDVLVVGDDSGYAFVDSVNAVISALFRAFDRDQNPHLVLPNPDLVYPASPGTFGFTSGSIAGLLESILAQRYPDRRPHFTPLGKPQPLLFELAAQHLGGGKLLMFGDQLHTDIAGANAAGIDSVLLETGVSRWQPGAPIMPTYLLASLAIPPEG